jgi:hypothetical protein
MTRARPQGAPVGGPRTVPAVWVASLALLLFFISARDADAAGARTDSLPAIAGADTAAALTEREFHLMPGPPRAMPLAHGFVVPGSLRLIVDGQAWREGRDYHLRARSGLVVPLRSWRAAAPDSAAAAGADVALVSATYRFVPVPIASRLDLRAVAPPPAAGAVRGIPGLYGAAGAAAAGGNEAWRDGNLRVTGSKTVQVSSGSRRELTVDQNLRLNIAGQLTPDIAVRAFLSDDNLPVVPEGNTEELKDIDRVLVEITAPAWNATLGDLVVQRRGTAFGDVRRKLQGLDVRARGGGTTVDVVAGAPRGAYRTIQLQGQEANQGPYRLAAGEGGSNLFLVAGSERVSLDGQTLVRGADRDYVIDYVLGTITFTYRRLITAESLVTVEFEEGEGAYSRTVVGGGVGHDLKLPLGGVPARLRARVFKEADDPKRLRTGDLAVGDEAVLAAAGDDPLRAVASGVTAAAPGQGQYDRQVVGADTTYVFNAVGGDWNLAFHHMGAGLGDYRLDSLTNTGQRVFVFTGAGLGTYRVGRPLVLPGSHNLATFMLQAGDSTGSGVEAEWNASQVDRNLLSRVDDGDNGGGAGRVAGRLEARTLAVGGRSLGRLSLRGAWESRDERFVPLQLRRSLIDYEGWGLGERARRTGFLDQADRQSDARAVWTAEGRRGRLDLTATIGSLSHDHTLRADRRALEAQWRLGPAGGRHEATAAAASDASDPLDIDRRSQRHELNWRLGPLQPAISHEQKQWIDTTRPAGRAAGFRLEENGVQVAGAAGSGATWRADFRRGLADSLRDGAWQLERDSRTAGAAVTSGAFGGMRLVGEGTWRRVVQPDGPEESTRLARLDLGGRWDRSLSDWSLGYRVDNSRTEVLDRQIVFVGERQGDFNENGEYLGRDLGGYSVVLAGTDSLVAVTAVRGDLRWRQGFAFLGKDRWYGAWSTQTVASLEGRSTTDEVGGLLALDPSVIFDGRTAVLADLNLLQEISLLEHQPRFDLRGRYGYRQTRDRQFADHPEDRLDRRWQATGSVNVNTRTTLRGRWAQDAERRESAEAGVSARRSQDLLTRRLELGWLHAPGPDLRLGLQGERVTRRDEVSAVAQREWALRPSARARLRGGWTVLLEARWADVQSAEPPGATRPFAFPYAGGNVDSTLRLSWEPSTYLTVSASWFARRQGDRGWQHDLRLESTARF